MQGQQKSDVMINVEVGSPSKIPDWVKLFDDTNDKINEMNDKSKLFPRAYLVAELKRMQIQRLKPKFNEEDGILDKNINAIMKSLNNVISFTNSLVDSKCL